MGFLSRKVDYGLLVLYSLSQCEEGGSARTISDQFGLSRAFVANILKSLRKKGLIESQRGVKGGYSLKISPEEIFLTDLMDALDEPFHLAECCQESPDESCSVFGRCPIKGPIAEFHSRIRNMLGSISLADLIEKSSDDLIPVELEVLRCK